MVLLEVNPIGIKHDVIGLAQCWVNYFRHYGNWFKIVDSLEINYCAKLITYEMSNVVHYIEFDNEESMINFVLRWS